MVPLLHRVSQTGFGIFKADKTRLMMILDREASDSKKIILSSGATGTIFIKTFKTISITGGGYNTGHFFDRVKLLRKLITIEKFLFLPL